MKFIQTKSFKLAVYSKGDENTNKLALVLPGRLDTKDYAHMMSHVDYLANLGYFTVSFDPPGSWESSGDVETNTTTTYLKAINELIEYFGNKPTLLVGHSRGGAAAMLAGAANKHVTAVVLIMATYANATQPMSGEIKSGIYVTSRSLPPGNDKSGETKELSLSLNYFEDAKKYSPASKLKKFTGPKLLIYSSGDAFTKPEEVKKVYDLLPEPKMLVEINTEHDYRYHPEVVEEVNQAIGKFLNKYAS